ncbi:hypothetical protein [Nostoc sp. FACHB-110]|uniref:hypothetical protein n=1 Tax=Nostoc sp. FACHB-110 TaxID=2692834 RepID=UPI0016890B87|nr:hypothetical protein [Nostoc sp. FACHB-110]MBD2439257.1 hypothetical protein [Nostoc sp. FACHB-110]
MSFTIQVSPPTNDLVLSQNQTLDEVVKVTIPKSGVVPKVDVYFLVDTTASMKPAIDVVKRDISIVLTEIGKLGSDVKVGIGEYKDFPAPVTGEHPYAFAHQHSLSSNLADIQAAVNTWTTTGGKDIPEAQFYALDQVAEPPSGKIGWRADSQRIIVWIGDAAGHDAVCQAISNLPYDITEESVTAKLVAEKITILAMSMNTDPRSPAGLDDDPKTTAIGYQPYCGEPGGTRGQGTRIANATGGKLLPGISPSTIIETINAELAAQITSIANVRLVPSGDIAQFVTAIAPATGYGPLSRDEDHEIAFTVSWVGAVAGQPFPQIFNGSLDVIADGQVVGGKPVKITVPLSFPPLPPIFPEDENSMPHPEDASGNWMLIHQVTGVYMISAGYQATVNYHVHIWRQDPLVNTTWNQGHLWTLIKQTDGSYLIRTWQQNPSLKEELYLEAAATTNRQDQYPRLQRRKNVDSQSWVLIPVSGDPNTYAIQSKAFPDYALSLLESFCKDGAHIITGRTWGKPTFHQYWRLSAPPA